MGPDIWGVQAASEAYFRKPAVPLARSEAAALAGLLPFPLRSNPALKPGRMRWRQNLILRRMAGESLEDPEGQCGDPGPGRCGHRAQRSTMPRLGPDTTP